MSKFPLKIGLHPSVWGRKLLRKHWEGDTAAVRDGSLLDLHKICDTLGRERLESRGIADGAEAGWGSVALKTSITVLLALIWDEAGRRM